MSVVTAASLAAAVKVASAALRSPFWYCASPSASRPTAAKVEPRSDQPVDARLDAADIAGIDEVEGGQNQRQLAQPLLVDRIGERVVDRDRLIHLALLGEIGRLGELGPGPGTAPNRASRLRRAPPGPASISPCSAASSAT